MKEALRHRALEAILRRLSQDADVEALALRGGMRVRQLFAQRRALDVDLVWRDDGDPTPAIRRVLLREVADGVTFEERIRVDAMHVAGALAGYRYIIAARVDGVGLDVMIDVRTDLTLGLQPTREKFEEGVVWMCRPETIVGRKLHVLAEAGPRHWRPKDLMDVSRLLGANPDLDALKQGIHEASPDAAFLRELFTATGWWTDPRARMRWRRYEHEVDLSACVHTLHSLGELVHP